MFNNKGYPVKKYEILFTNTHRYQPKIIEGVTTMSFYEPMRRFVTILSLDHTWLKTVHSAWGEQVWDSSDTVLLDAERDIDVGGYFKQLDLQDYQPSRMLHLSIDI